MGARGTGAYARSTAPVVRHPAAVRRRRRAGPELLFVLILALLSGCGHDDSGGTTGVLSGSLTEFSGGAPLAGARVVLIAPATNRVVAVAMTSGDGHYRMSGLAPGRYYAAASSGRFIAFETRDDALEIRGGRVTRQDFRLGDYPYLDPDLPPVSGRVEDADTGAPIAGAYVSVGDTDLASLFAGITAPWEALTDADGEFELPFVPFVSDPRSGTLLGLYPVVATHPGYDPAATGSVRRGQLMPLPFPPGSSTRVTLRLHRSLHTGRLRGRVVHAGARVPNVPVALTLVDTALVQAPAGPPSPRAAEPGGLRPQSLMTGQVALSDADGGFDLPAVPPGRYRVVAAYWPDDGWVQPPGVGAEGVNLVTIRAGTELDVELRVLPALRLLSPAAGASVSTGRPLLRWDPVAGAEFYRVRFSNADGYLLTNAALTAETSLLGPLGYWGDGDWVRWAVEAYQGEELIALSDAIATFVVRSRGGPGL